MTVAKKLNSLAACQKWANSCVFIPTRGNFCALVWPQFLHSIVAKTAIRRNLQRIVKNADIAHFLRRPQYFNSLFSEQGGSVGGSVWCSVGGVLRQHPSLLNAFVQRACSRLGGVLPYFNEVTLSLQREYKSHNNS